MLRVFCSGDPLLFSAHPVRGLPCCPDHVSNLLGALVVDVLKSGIYDLWVAVAIAVKFGLSSGLLEPPAQVSRRKPRLATLRTLNKQGG